MQYHRQNLEYIIIKEKLQQLQIYPTKHSPHRYQPIMFQNKSQNMASKTFSSQFLSNSIVLTQNLNPMQRLALAIKTNRMDLLSSIGTSQKQLKCLDEAGKNLLFYAVYYKSQTCLLYLLRSGLNYKYLDNQKKNIYHFITNCGSIECLQILQFWIKLSMLRKLNEDMLKLLQKYGYRRTDMKDGVLKYRVSPKRQAMFKQLQKQGTQMYKKYIHGYLSQMYQYLSQIDQNTQRNPIHLGCFNRYQKCLPTLQLLFQQISNPNIQINNKILQNFNATNAYFKQNIDPRNYSDILQCLSQLLLPVDKKYILQQYQKQAKKKIRQLLQIKDKDQQTALHIASKNGSTGLINFLQKYQPNQKQQQKQQIMKVASNNLTRSRIIDLCQASQLVDIKPLNFLISCGEWVNQKKSIFGTFPLVQALVGVKKNNSMQAFKELIKSGADPNIQDTNGWTVLHHAASQGFPQVIQHLINTQKQTNLDINKVTNKRYHALHLASMNQHAEIIKILIQKTNNKVNIDIADWDGCTALIHAAKKGSIKVLKQLLNLNANIYAKDVRDMTALHHAAFSNHSQCIKQLLNYDSDYDKLRYMRNTKGKLAKDLCTASQPFYNIFTAARTGDVNLMRKLIAQNGSAKDSTTLKRELTPLILAVQAKSFPCVKFLVDCGADTYHEDKIVPQKQKSNNKKQMGESNVDMKEGKSAAGYCDELLAQAKKKKDNKQIMTLEQIKRILQS